MASAGRTLSKVTVAASCLAWRLPVRTKASYRFVGAMIGMLFGIAVVTVIINYIRHHLGIGVAGLSFLAGLAIYALAWLVLSALLPRPSSDPGALLPGAVIVATTIAGMQAISQLYLPGRFESASAAVRRHRRHDRHPRLVLHRRPGDRAVVRGRRRGLRALRKHLAAGVLATVVPPAAPAMGVVPADVPTGEGEQRMTTEVVPPEPAAPEPVTKESSGTVGCDRRPPSCAGCSPSCASC